MSQSPSDSAQQPSALAAAPQVRSSMQTANVPVPTSPTSARTIKLLLIGDSETGKSSLMVSYADERFLGVDHSVTTVGVDLRTFRKVFSGITYKICIWDTAGQERFRALTKSFYREALVVFVVFDVSNRFSFDSLDSWCEEVSRHCGDAVIRVLVANKIDVPLAKREVSSNEAVSYAIRNGLSYREVSAKTMDGVKTLFEEFAQKAIEVPPREGEYAGNISVAESRANENSYNDNGFSCLC